MISLEVNFSHSSSGKQSTVNSCQGAKNRGFFDSPLISDQQRAIVSWGPEVTCRDFFFPSIFRHVFTLLNSITWHQEACREKNLQGEELVFALGWKSDTINENNNWTLWAWIGMKHNTKSMFVIPIVLINCLWRALSNAHGSIFSFFVVFNLYPLLHPVPSSLFSSRKKKSEKLWTCYRLTSENTFQWDFRTRIQIYFPFQCQDDMGERNEVISQPSA